VADVLDAFLWGLDPNGSDGRVRSVTIEDGSPGTDAELGPIVAAGLADLVIEAAISDALPAERRRRVGDAIAKVDSLIPVVRYTWFDHARKTEQRERVARGRRLENELTTSWLVPRLRQDIAAYRARIDMLRWLMEGS